MSNVILTGDEITRVDSDSDFTQDDSFNFDDFQIVRREFFYHMNEPSISFSDYKVGVNMACIKKLPHAEYIQYLVDEKKGLIAIRPCDESAIHSFRWFTENTRDKRKPRTITGKWFFLKIFNMMNWDVEHRVKVMGKPIMAKGEKLIVFNLHDAETYVRERKANGKRVTSRTPVLPSEWKDQFGVPFRDHQKMLQINIFDENFAVYSLQDDAPTASLSGSST